LDKRIFLLLLKKYPVKSILFSKNANSSFMYNTTLISAYDAVKALRGQIEADFYAFMGKRSQNRFLDLVTGRAEATQAEKEALKYAFGRLKLPDAEALFPATKKQLKRA
jgi:hypothetical protein